MPRRQDRELPQIHLGRTDRGRGRRYGPHHDIGRRNSVQSIGCGDRGRGSVAGLEPQRSFCATTMQLTFIDQDLNVLSFCHGQSSPGSITKRSYLNAHLHPSRYEGD
jgi:hypothetical protein